MLLVIPIVVLGVARLLGLLVEVRGKKGLNLKEGGGRGGHVFCTHVVG